jgi:hypothetical protein
MAKKSKGLSTMVGLKFENGACGALAQAGAVHRKWTTLKIKMMHWTLENDYARGSRDGSFVMYRNVLPLDR